MMKAQNFPGGSSYFYILIGIALAFISALVPHYSAGYFLMISVLVAGLLPYMVYGIAVPLLHNGLTNAAGFILVFAHLWLVITERFINDADYSNYRIYFVPVIFSVILLPLAIKAVRTQSYTPHTTTDSEATESESPKE